MQKKSIFKNTIYKFILSTFNIIIPLVVKPYIHGLLDKQQFGTYNKALSIVSFFMILGSFGIYNFGVREISKVKEDKEKTANLFTNLFIFGTITNVISIALFILYVFLFVNNTQQSIFYVMIIQLFGNAFYIEWINEANENYGFITKKTIFIRVLSTVLIFLMVVKPSHTILYAIIMSVTNAVNNFASYFYIKKNIKFNFKNINIKQYFKPLIPMVLISNITVLYSLLDRLTLGWFVSDISVTEYDIPANLLNMIVIVMMSTITVSLPRLNYYIAKGEENSYLWLLNQSVRSYLMLVFPSCVGLFALSYEVTMLYGTAKYISAYPVMQVFAIRFMISCLKIIYTDQIMFVYKKEKEISKLLITGGIINLAFKVFLIITKSLSPITAIFTTMISEIVVLVMLHLYTKKVLKVKFSILQFKNIKYLYISLTFIPIIYVIKYFNLGILLTCFISVTICALYYLVFLIATKDDILKYYFDKFTNKLFKNNKLKK